jgi:replication-associated recombination protein RarA
MDASRSLDPGNTTPLILTGPPGCGKSHWIQTYANNLGKQLYVCPCRKDRTLRDGRQKLHIWARRTEPAILWLEGADDLTPEAQAFLRRILETHASDVLFILECRDAGRLQEPIRSRCKIKRILKPSWDDLSAYCKSLQLSKLQPNEIQQYLQPNEYSYRRVNHCVFLQLHYPEIWSQIMTSHSQESKEISNLSEKNLITYIKNGYNPEVLCHSLLTNDSLTEEMREKLLKDYGKCNELSGSLWAFLGSALYTVFSRPENEEE